MHFAKEMGCLLTSPYPTHLPILPVLQVLPVPLVLPLLSVLSRDTWTQIHAHTDTHKTAHSAAHEKANSVPLGRGQREPKSYMGEHEKVNSVAKKGVFSTLEKVNGDTVLLGAHSYVCEGQLCGQRDSLWLMETPKFCWEREYTPFSPLLLSPLPPPCPSPAPPPVEGQQHQCADQVHLVSGRWPTAERGAPKRRRERELRSFLKHERMTVRMTLAEALLHSCGVGPDGTNAPWGPKTASQSERQWQKATIDRGNPLWKEVKN